MSDATNELENTTILNRPGMLLRTHSSTSKPFCFGIFKSSRSRSIDTLGSAPLPTPFRYLIACSPSGTAVTIFHGSSVWRSVIESSSTSSSLSSTTRTRRELAGSERFIGCVKYGHYQETVHGQPLVLRKSCQNSAPDASTSGDGLAASSAISRSEGVPIGNRRYSPDREKSIYNRVPSEARPIVRFGNDFGLKNDFLNKR